MKFKKNYEIQSFIQGISSCCENQKCKVKEALDFQGPSWFSLLLLQWKFARTNKSQFSVFLLVLLNFFKSVCVCCCVSLWVSLLNVSLLSDPQSSLSFQCVLPGLKTKYSFLTFLTNILKQSHSPLAKCFKETKVNSSLILYKRTHLIYVMGISVLIHLSNYDFFQFKFFLLIIFQEALFKPSNI